MLAAMTMEQVMRLFERMKGEGIEPDEVAYGVIVNYICKARKRDNVVEWFKFCKRKGVAVNSVFYSSLIDGFGKVRMVEGAERLINEMVEN